MWCLRDWGENGGIRPPVLGEGEGAEGFLLLSQHRASTPLAPLDGGDGVSTHEDPLNQIISQEEMKMAFGSNLHFDVCIFAFCFYFTLSTQTTSLTRITPKFLLGL